MANEEKRKVIFGDAAATVKYPPVVQSLEKIDIVCEMVTDADKLNAALAKNPYDILVFNLLLGGTGPFEFIRNIKKIALNPNMKIIVVTRQVHKLNIQNTMAAGAHDFIGDPFETLNLYHRILYHMGPIHVIDRGGFEQSMPGVQSTNFIKMLLEANELLSRTEREKIATSFFKIVSHIASLLESNRTNLVIVDETTNSGVVIASSDDASFSNFPIILDKYPEVLHVCHTGNLVMVEDVSKDSLTDRITKEVKTIAIGSLMVFPVYFQGEVVGTLNIRRPKATELPSPDTLRILQAAANLMAAHSHTAGRLRKIYKDFNSKTAA